MDRCLCKHRIAKLKKEANAKEYWKRQCDMARQSLRIAKEIIKENEQEIRKLKKALKKKEVED